MTSYLCEAFVCLLFVCMLVSALWVGVWRVTFAAAEVALQLSSSFTSAAATVALRCCVDAAAMQRSFLCAVSINRLVISWEKTQKEGGGGILLRSRIGFGCWRQEWHHHSQQKVLSSSSTQPRARSQDAIADIIVRYYWANLIGCRYYYWQTNQPTVSVCSRSRQCALPSSVRRNGLTIELMLRLFVVVVSTTAAARNGVGVAAVPVRFRESDEPVGTTATTTTTSSC